MCVHIIVHDMPQSSSDRLFALLCFRPIPELRCCLLEGRDTLKLDRGQTTCQSKVISFESYHPHVHIHTHHKHQRLTAVRVQNYSGLQTLSNSMAAHLLVN